MTFEEAEKEVAFWSNAYDDAKVIYENAKIKKEATFKCLTIASRIQFALRVGAEKDVIDELVNALRSAQ